jgi:hypothetical protein
LRHRRVGIAFVVAALVIACASPRPRLPSSAPSIEGSVTAVDPQGEGIGSIRVEANPAETSGSDKAVVYITRATEIVRGDSVRANFAALARGQWVRVWFTGPVRESYPVQADAALVQIDTAR